MKAARHLERRLERVFDGLVSRAMPGRLEASELSARLAREADLAEFTSPAGPATANLYRLRIHPDDLPADPEDLARRLAATLSAHAADVGWRLDGPVIVEFEGSRSQKRRTVACAASVSPAPLPAWGRLSDHFLGHNRVLVGRSKICDLRLNTPEVSRRHAVVFRQGGAVWITDLASANGTFLDGVRLGRSTMVVAGAVISMGGEFLRFEPCPT
jgi:hypothetical protein